MWSTADRPNLNVMVLDSHRASNEAIATHIDHAIDLFTAARPTTIASAIDHLIHAQPNLAVVAEILTDGTALDFLNHLTTRRLNVPTIVLSTIPVISTETLTTAGAAAHLFKTIADFDLHPLIRRCATP